MPNDAQHIKMPLSPRSVPNQLSSKVSGTCCLLSRELLPFFLRICLGICIEKQRNHSCLSLSASLPISSFGIVHLSDGFGFPGSIFFPGSAVCFHFVSLWAILIFCYVFRLSCLCLIVCHCVCFTIVLLFCCLFVWLFVQIVVLRSQCCPCCQGEDSPS